ncbi:hypothetical protein B0T25DRAFT_572340 [Lasiosphaeria hispida]|uniref:NTF2-like domain-containing protein n=1 Tax=Lasiosphaeria hispida TaxID=260671 RepID=A0AAJ0MBF2_9PEZI|nr:hypothetical protein B0T25DRAFT_572340 [Lasiosphaeria hispida]
MQLIKSLAVLGLAAMSSAAAIDSSPVPLTLKKTIKSREEQKCLCQSDVDYLIDGYSKIIQGWKPEYEVFLHPDLIDYSDSINVLAGVPLGVPIFPTKADFIQHQEVAPDTLPLIVTKLGPWDCDELSFVWTASFPESVRGVTILGAKKTDEGLWAISRIDVEFNSLTFFKNIGGTVTPPGAPARV